MALQETETEQTTNGDSTKKAVALKVRLKVVDNADRPILSNYTTLNIAPAMVYLDFGFLDPNAVTALTQTARTDKATPLTLDGKLAARVAMPLDALLRLHQQVQQVLVSLRGRKTSQKGELKGPA
jgi:hypothetical protein